MQFSINAILTYAFPKGSCFGAPWKFTAIRSFNVNASLIRISKCAKDEGYLDHGLEYEDEAYERDDECGILSAFLTRNKSLVPEELRLFTKEMADEFLAEYGLDPSFAVPLAEKCIPLKSVEVFPELPKRMAKHDLTEKQRETVIENIRSFLV